jgi:DeoR/GlpR family transcriptional regulator of sugar metabolism
LIEPATILRMLAAERRQLIIERVRSRGAVAITDMAKVLGTSEITLRRDLREMAEQGLLVRTRGGAVLPGGLTRGPIYLEKATQAAAEKAAIARVAVQLIRPGDSIILSHGTTTLALARLLVDFQELTVVTNSLLVAEALMPAARVEVMLIGGTLLRSIHALVGPAAEDSVRPLRVSKAFISGNGLTAKRGLSTPSPLVAAADRALAAAAERVVVLADRTKIGCETMCRTVPPTGINTLITDSRADRNELVALSEAGVEIHVAGLDEDETEMSFSSY